VAFGIPTGDGAVVVTGVVLKSFLAMWALVYR